MREVNRELGLALQEPDGVTTIAGLTKLAGGIPNRAARLAANDGIVLVVLDASARAVRRVRVIPPPTRPAPGGIGIELARRAKAAPPPQPIAGGSEPFEGSELASAHRRGRRAGVGVAMTTKRRQHQEC